LISVKRRWRETRRQTGRIFVDDATTKLGCALAEIDAANALDPNQIDVGGTIRPAELVYGERMSAMLGKIYPGASQELTIAARAQHLQRWTIPRTDYPMERKGYLRWRNELKKRHAVLAGEIMERCGFDSGPIERAGALIRKEHLKKDAEAQALEDVACLVFLQYYCAGFAAGRDEEQLVGILRKTWGKMSEKGRAAALALELDSGLGRLVSKALEPTA
jgi:hypothetical protein